MTFKDTLKKKLEETVGYGVQFPGQMPIQMIDFPSQQPEVNGIEPKITSGETTPFGQPRQDKAMEVNQPQADTAVIDEVGNLLLTIGFILNNAGLISDRFNAGEILDFVNHNFEQPMAPTEQNPLSPVNGGCCGGAHSCGSECSCVSQNPGYTYLQEKRKLFESRHRPK
jgi:hypothetical protein